MAFALLLAAVATLASGGQVFRGEGCRIKLAVRRIHGVVKQVLRRDDAVVHLISPHVLAFAHNAALQVRSSARSYLGIAVSLMHVQGRVVMVLQVVVTL